MTDRVDIPPGFDSERSDSMTKRYPTRMHEICRMEPMIPFEFVCNGMKYTLVIEHEGHVWRLNHAKGRRMLAASVVCELVNHPERITRRPRLTEEQVAQLKALHTLGYRWLTKDKWKGVSAFICKPFKGEHGGEWMRYDPMLVDDGYIVFNGYTQITDLVSWSDPEPLDIVQVLRQNGEEVEG